MNLSPEQLKFIARVCESLDKLEEDQDTAIICLGSLEIIIGDFVVGKCEDVYTDGFVFVPLDEPIRTS